MNYNELLLLHSKYENPIEIEQLCPGNGFNFSRIFLNEYAWFATIFTTV